MSIFTLSRAGQATPISCPPWEKRAYCQNYWQIHTNASKMDFKHHKVDQLGRLTCITYIIFIILLVGSCSPSTGTATNPTESQSTTATVSSIPLQSTPIT